MWNRKSSMRWVLVNFVKWIYNFNISIMWRENFVKKLSSWSLFLSKLNWYFLLFLLHLILLLYNLVSSCFIHLYGSFCINNIKQKRAILKQVIVWFEHLFMNLTENKIIFDYNFERNIINRRQLNVNSQLSLICRTMGSHIMTF